MKKLLLMFALLFSTAMQSSPVRAEWTRVIENENGTIFYVDLERIRKHDGYVYYWQLADNLKPWDEFFSSTLYIQGDCKLFRLKTLSFSSHKKPMGEGGAAKTDNTPDKDWFYPPPESAAETVLKLVCSQ